MYILRFNKVDIGKYKTTDEAWSKLKDYVDNVLHFKSYYYRCNYLSLGKEDIQVDYGSHTNFFYIIKEED